MSDPNAGAVRARAEERARHERARSTEPRIEVNQRWVALADDGKVLRRVRILAPHPDGGWIFCDEVTGNRRIDFERSGEIRVFPEYNLRFVCVLERPNECQCRSFFERTGKHVFDCPLNEETTG